MILEAAVAALIASPPVAAPAIRLEVPVIRQAPEHCGPAALEMVLRYYGAPAAALSEAERTYEPALRGALITDLAAAARRAGYPAAVAAPGPDSLPALLARGVPPILLVSAGIGPIARGHYIVVTGWDAARRRYEVNDGGRAARGLDAGDLARRWRAAGGRALLVRRADPAGAARPAR